MMISLAKDDIPREQWFPLLWSAIWNKFLLKYAILHRGIINETYLINIDYFVSYSKDWNYFIFFKFGFKKTSGRVIL